jgi:hypothetical protein
VALDDIDHMVKSFRFGWLKIPIRICRNTSENP